MEMKPTDVAVFSEQNEDRRRRDADSTRSSFSSPERCTEKERKERRKGGSSQRDQSGDGSSRCGCSDLDTAEAFARVLRSLDLDSPRVRCDKVCYSSEQPFTAVMQFTSSSTYKKNMHKQRDEYARAGTGTYRIVYRKSKKGSAKSKVAMGVVEPFHGQRVKDVVGGARKNVESQKSRQK